MAVLRETDLFPLLRDWLEAAGYAVRAEVNHCDVAARRGDELILIEMKRAVTLDLLLQAVRRQSADAAVYVAVPAPAARDRRWREIERLLKRLELGLLLVAADSAVPGVELRFHPVEQVRQRRKAATRAILAEMDRRSMNLNVGGQSRRPVMTAYRERALGIAVALAEAPAAPRALRRRGTTEKTGGILRDNHYGWFERIAKGLYGLTAAGRRALEEYPEMAAAWRGKLLKDG